MLLLTNPGHSFLVFMQVTNVSCVLSTYLVLNVSLHLCYHNAVENMFV